MFEAALETIQPNFPPGVLGADPRFLQNVYNLSEGTVRGPWNQGEIKGMGKDFVYVEKPLEQALDTVGQTNLPDNFDSELKESKKLDKELSEVKSGEEKKAEPKGVAQWSTYSDKQTLV